MGHWWGLLIGVLVIVGFVVGFLAAMRANRRAADVLSIDREIALRRLLVRPYRDDGTPMSAADLTDRICDVLDIELVIPPPKGVAVEAGRDAPKDASSG